MRPVVLLSILKSRSLVQIVPTMNSLNQLWDGAVQCSCCTRSKLSVGVSRGQGKRQANSVPSSRQLYLQALWVLIVCCCISPIQCSDGATTTVDSLLTTSLSTTPAPVPFDLGTCLSVIENRAQRQYICMDHPKLFYILQYAENISRLVCEEQFEKNIWNCSHFSLIKEPKISLGSDDINQELAYVNALSFAGIALSVAQACSSHYGHHEALCECKEGGNCVDNLTYAFEVAETFLTKRYEGQPINPRLNLIHRNYAAAKQHIIDLIDTTDESCKCHGVSGSCTVKTCNGPELPSFREVANNIHKAYENACKVVSRDTSRISWVSDCNRAISNNDLLYNRPEEWCRVNPAIGSLGTAGRECQTTADASATNSCQKLCTDCGLDYEEHHMEVESNCECKFEFCCRITCKVCRGTRTYYACST